MATATDTSIIVERTEHPHIVKAGRTAGGWPQIEGTRMPVLRILEMYEAGMSVQQIVEEFSHLSLAQVHDALSYAYDHPDEMADFAASETLRSVLKRSDLVFVDHRLIPRSRFNPAEFPPETPAYTWETLPPELDE